MSDIASWRWVLLDLSKRLDEAVGALNHEHNALRVVIKRIHDEIQGHSQEASKPGALSPLSDCVEEAILQEYNFLREQKKKFENMIPDIEKRIEALKKTKKRIEADVLNKQQTLSIDEACGSNSCTPKRAENGKKMKRKASTLMRWNNRCEGLKRSGLRVLTNAIITRQQVRGARVYLSIAAQGYAARVDSALRRRLHANKIKLQDLNWQREEAIRDHNTLEEELINTEQNLLGNMDQERVVEARLADRSLRPPGELTKDEVNRQLREELARLRSFSKHLRMNIDRTTSLQHNLTDSITRMDCYAEDLIRVIRLDEERIHFRLGEELQSVPSANILPGTGFTHSDSPLTVIQEEVEDDYPFDN
ncbi:hypothetical protein O3G_MSEX001231 [Manduca sexta]|uniref:Tektin n=3 Tax=Manduca sexta TaxID=7130 RepID=A0A921YJJ0_MANSE|nr:hypothetical protein O3G_MSEX001231 [Manduca sexta]